MFTDPVHHRKRSYRVTVWALASNCLELKHIWQHTAGKLKPRCVICSVLHLIVKHSLFQISGGITCSIYVSSQFLVLGHCSSAHLWNKIVSNDSFWS